MKTLVRLPEGASTFLFEDADEIFLHTTHVTVGNPEKVIIMDMNTQNTAIVENITPPTDWMPWKYLFDGITWTPNPDWFDPGPPPVFAPPEIY